MESVGANEGNKRRLPPWMMAGVASNLTGQGNKDDSVGSVKPGGVGSEVSVPKVKTRSRKVVKKNMCGDEETCVTEEVSAPKTKTRSRKIVNESLDEDDEVRESEDVIVTKMKRRPKRGQKGTPREDEEVSTDKSCVLVKCATVKRNRTFNSEVEDSDMNNIGNENLEQISATRKKKKGTVNKLIPKEVSSSSTESRRHLVMEDLISIAEEYVKAESLTDQHQQTVGASGPKENLSDADPSSDGCLSSLDGARTKGLPDATEVKSNLPSASYQVQNSSTLSNISSTGDAAQDMLNLLLGPLLMKPVEESTTTNSDEMLFDRPVQNQSQIHNVEELAPAVKKKTSLKDKVAMFFD